MNGFCFVECVRVVRDICVVLFWKMMYPPPTASIMPQPGEVLRGGQ